MSLKIETSYFTTEKLNTDIVSEDEKTDQVN